MVRFNESLFTIPDEVVDESENDLTTMLDDDDSGGATKQPTPEREEVEGVTPNLGATVDEFDTHAEFNNPGEGQSSESSSDNEAAHPQPRSSGRATTKSTKAAEY